MEWKPWNIGWRPYNVKLGQRLQNHFSGKVRQTLKHCKIFVPILELLVNLFWGLWEISVDCDYCLIWLINVLIQWWTKATQKQHIRSKFSWRKKFIWQRISKNLCYFAISHWISNFWPSPGFKSWPNLLKFPPQVPK